MPTRRPPAVPDHVADAIRRRLRELREAAGLSLAELSARAGLSPAAVSLIERGANSPALGTLCAVAGALGVEVTELLAAPKRRRSTY